MNDIRFYILEEAEKPSLFNRFTTGVKEKFEQFKTKVWPILKVFVGVSIGVILVALAAGTLSLFLKNLKFRGGLKSYPDVQGPPDTEGRPTAISFGIDELKKDLKEREAFFKTENKNNPEKVKTLERVDKTLLAWFSRKRSSTPDDEEVKRAEEIIIKLSKDIGKDKEFKEFILSGAKV
jgi:hypothetical protein